MALSCTQQLNISDLGRPEAMSAALKRVGNALGPPINIERQPPKAGLLANTASLPLEPATLGFQQTRAGTSTASQL
ncbi:hypothetical protein AO067_05170 [Pseudomonas viridiflava ICMP 13104]|uniref:Uncharacterized protein n=1 Tax=Pseudomonas viridiflava ICMP 13104 TaxID=1198305 RepID=A0A0W0HEF8_PSEVI|nr:hypothetical protein AO067_05170 [Pseudomonas viridiflava ICMP 13104]